MRGCVTVLVLACVGCGPLKIGYPDTGDGPKPVDSEPGDSEPGETTASLPACEDTEWPDKAVAVNESCTLPPAEMELERMWLVTHPWLLYAGTFTAGRFLDEDESGDIGPEDPMYLMVMSGSLDSSLEGGPSLWDGRGELIRSDSAFLGTRSLRGILADVDSDRLGIEAIIGAESVSWDDGQDALGVFDESGVAVSSTFDDFDANDLWPLDLEGDGEIEVLWGGAIRCVATGEILVELEGFNADDNSLVTDLDLDGLPDIIGVTRDGDLARWNVAGELVVTYGELAHPGQVLYPELLVANLDDDDEGEILVEMSGFLSILEPDGALIHSAASDLSFGDIAIGELDGDEFPEIVSYFHSDEARGLIAFEHDLSLKWRVDGAESSLSGPTLADLDADGIHELLFFEQNHLLLVGSDGQIRHEGELPAYCNNQNPPLVVDIDGDDLAEIVVLCGFGWMAAFENPSGGWAVRGADMPWPSADHHPGDRAFDGGLPDSSVPHWLEPGGNVWHGLAAGAPDLPDLGLELAEVCALGDGSTRVTAYLGNRGLADLQEPVDLVLSRLTDGLEYQRVSSCGDLVSGMATAIRLEAELGTPTTEVTVSIDAGGRVAECQDSDNELNVELADHMVGGE